MSSQIILCGTDGPQRGSAPYFIGYSDMVDGYRHAWTEMSPSGRQRLRRGRSANHPADPRCPECNPTPTTETREDSRPGDSGAKPPSRGSVMRSAGESES